MQSLCQYEWLSLKFQVGFYRDFFYGQAGPPNLAIIPRTRVFLGTWNLAGRGRLASAFLIEFGLVEWQQFSSFRHVKVGGKPPHRTRNRLNLFGDLGDRG